ncbi:MAG: hypothetical protein DDT41_01370 [candidate division WS2 bacterium]|nr:hypothetical protein [Candidatus Psychracetigena formicireducens]
MSWAEKRIEEYKQGINANIGFMKELINCVESIVNRS